MYLKISLHCLVVGSRQTMGNQVNSNYFSIDRPTRIDLECRLFLNFPNLAKIFQVKNNIAQNLVNAFIQKRGIHRKKIVC